MSKADLSAANETLQVKVRSITYQAEEINSYELRLPSGGELPTFEAGAHINVHLPNGLIRSYSLLNRQDDRHRYAIAVARDRGSRGGSRFLHEALRVGDMLTISAPRNNFPLWEDARHSLLIAGGIGITPIWSMIQRLDSLGRSWQLYYAARNRHSAALFDELCALRAAANHRIHIHFDQEQDGQTLDIAGIVAAQSPDTHLYCCGPAPMLVAFERATQSRSRETVHVEYFSAAHAPDVTGGFTVVLAKSGKSMSVPCGKTILDVLLDAGVPVQYSCMEGICSSCETHVLEGEPDHRDVVLSAEERASNKVMMVCCSGSRSEKLVLDL
jgi:ferredoxin-NADP reductase